MNFAALMGTFLGIAVTAFAILTSTQNPAVFADVHGIVIVIGGTVTVALLCFPFLRLLSAVRIVARKVFGREKIDYLGTIQTIVQLSQIYRVDPKKALESIPPKSHPFLRDGMQLLVDYGFSQEELDSVLSNALRGKKKRDDEEVKVWHTVARFPPAFGLLGATVGMISLLQTLGEPGAQDRIGPAMATALVATFYGLTVANFLLIPLAEKLSSVSKEDGIMRSIILEGVLMIQEKRHPVYIEEYLKSFLAPKYRNLDLSSDNSKDQKAA